jgi:hypothetical protein
MSTIRVLTRKQMMLEAGITAPTLRRYIGLGAITPKKVKKERICPGAANGQRRVQIFFEEDVQAATHLRYNRRPRS